MPDSPLLSNYTKQPEVNNEVKEGSSPQKGSQYDYTNKKVSPRERCTSKQSSESTAYNNGNRNAAHDNDKSSDSHHSRKGNFWLISQYLPFGLEKNSDTKLMVLNNYCSCLQ